MRQLRTLGGNAPLLLIYAIVAGDSGEVIYVGQTRKGLEYRARRHREAFRDEKRLSRLITWARAHPDVVVSFVPLEVCVLESELDAREVHWISELEPPCNVQAGGALASQSAQARAKRRVSNKAAAAIQSRNVTEATRERLRFAYSRRGPASATTRAKMSATRSGAGNHNFGRTFAPETRALMSAAAMGNSRRRGAVPSDETKALLSIRAHEQWHVRRGVVSAKCAHCSIPALTSAA